MKNSQSAISHIRGDEGKLIQIGGFGTRVKVPGGLTDGSVSLVEHTLEPGLLGAPPHRHTREDETSFVLEGQLTVQIGDETATAHAGEIIVKPRGSFHAFWNVGEQPVRFLEVISPGGFEEYFEELGRIIPADGPPDMGAIVALGERYGMEFDMAAVPVLLQRHGLRLG
jgi:quercetin dioxygenase-like cupin family protein